MLSGTGRIRFAEGDTPTVVFERFDLIYSGIVLEQATRRTLVLRNVTLEAAFVSRPGAGDLFLEDVCGSPWHFTRQNVWARQLNTECKGTKIINDRSNFWVLGLKTENPGTLVETKNGGKTEVVGGFSYSNSGHYIMPMFIVTDSSLSVTLGESNYNGTPWQILVRETQGGGTRELKWKSVPRREASSLLPLYRSAPARF